MFMWILAIICIGSYIAVIWAFGEMSLEQRLRYFGESGAIGVMFYFGFDDIALWAALLLGFVVYSFLFSKIYPNGGY